MKLNVEGVTCGHCERAVERAVVRLGGAARVDLDAGTVDVQGVEDAVAVRAAIEDEGYRVVDAPAASASRGCCQPRSN